MNTHTVPSASKRVVANLRNNVAIPCNPRLDFEHTESQPVLSRLIQSFLQC